MTRFRSEGASRRGGALSNTKATRYEANAPECGRVMGFCSRATPRATLDARGYHLPRSGAGVRGMGFLHKHKKAAQAAVPTFLNFWALLRKRAGATWGKTLRPRKSLQAGSHWFAEVSGMS